MSQFEEQLAKAWPPTLWSRVLVVVAVSGGADSVALLRGLVALTRQSSAELVVGHFDHRLRDGASKDARFVAKLCRKLDVRCEMGRTQENLRKTQDGSLEQVAREARYEFLTQVARQSGARYIATGHTADDQAETILHRVVRGTGLRGLAGIPKTRQITEGVTLIRPLLAISRARVVEYLDAINQPFCTDASNGDECYTRNRIRNSLLPELRKDYNAQVGEALCRLGQIAGEANAYVESVAQELFDASVICSDVAAVVRLDKLMHLPTLIVRAMLRQVWQTMGWPERDMTFEHWNQLERFALLPLHELAQTTLNLPGDIRATRDEKNNVTIKNHGQP